MTDHTLRVKPGPGTVLVADCTCGGWALTTTLGRPLIDALHTVHATDETPLPVDDPPPVPYRRHIPTRQTWWRHRLQGR